MLNIFFYVFLIILFILVCITFTIFLIKIYNIKFSDIALYHTTSIIKLNEKQDNVDNSRYFKLLAEIDNLQLEYEALIKNFQQLQVNRDNLSKVFNIALNANLILKKEIEKYQKILQEINDNNQDNNISKKNIRNYLILLLKEYIQNLLDEQILLYQNNQPQPYNN